MPSTSWEGNSVDEENKPGPTEWNAHPVGVGPWEDEHPGEPRPTEQRYDPELLDEGDKRNVVDAYRYWTREAIVEDIDTRRHPLHIAIENFENDSNIGTVVRTANAFAVDTVHIVGRKRWNRRGAMVTDRYQHLIHHADVSSVLEYAKAHDLTVVAVDNTPGSVPLETAELPERCLLLFGQEGPGVTHEAQTGSSMTVSIAQFGSTRSINAGVAAGIAMHAWVKLHADLRNSW
nr:TrmH family RNA methyltransferase [Corynebacterium sp. ED61]